MQPPTSILRTKETPFEISFSTKIIINIRSYNAKYYKWILLANLEVLSQQVNISYSNKLGDVESRRGHYPIKCYTEHVQKRSANIQVVLDLVEHGERLSVKFTESNCWIPFYNLTGWYEQITAVHEVPHTCDKVPVACVGSGMLDWQYLSN